MRVRILAILCLILSSNGLFAKVGLVGGVNLSKINFSKVQNTVDKYRIGGFGGLSFEIKAPKVFALDIALVYDLRGSRQSTLFGYTEVQNTMHYLEVPVHFKFYIKKKFNFYAGPYVSYLVAANLKGKNSAGQVETKNYLQANNLNDFVDADKDAILNRLDYGVNGGIEFMPITRFGFGLRYSVGLGDLTNASFNPSTTLANIINNAKAGQSAIQLYGIVRF